MKRVASGFLPMIAVDRKDRKPLHRQIYEAYRTAIVSGSLRAAQRIPSSRVLASELGVSRFPVLNAYGQLLAEGYFESRVGAGTVVSSSLPEQFTPSELAGAEFAASGGSRQVASRCSILPRLEKRSWMGLGAFGVGQVAFEQFPIQIWTALVARRCRNMDARSFHYGDPTGSKALRETLAAYLRTSRSVRCEAEQIMIVSGSQQALEISARVLLDPGSRVWVEEPGYSLARGIFALTGCHLVPVPVDGEGLNVTAGIQRARRARAAFVTPSHQFPLGVTMSASRRFQLLDWAQSTGSWIIEDDYDSEYRYESMPIASLQGLDKNARVIYIGTFSKVLFPSLRLGYVVVPNDLAERFQAVRRVMDLAPPTFYQEVLAEFIGEGHFARHIRRMRVLYRDRRSALVESLTRELGSTVEVLGGEAGMHLTVTLPQGSRDLEIADRAARENLWLWPLSLSYMGATPRQGFILGFGSTAVMEVAPAVRKMSKLLAAK
ncbi:MAG TPA: PLP-dependent aminotransferase family protein [Candidatus Sulfotelmatobacter sp.]|nr:PLP-dependent aminotransferase family protein [Candidatus Sulfotelmatobacter sp.]